MRRRYKKGESLKTEVKSKKITCNLHIMNSTFSAKKKPELFPAFIAV